MACLKTSVIKCSLVISCNKRLFSSNAILQSTTRGQYSSTSLHTAPSVHLEPLCSFQLVPGATGPGRSHPRGPGGDDGSRYGPAGSRNVADSGAGAGGGGDGYGPGRLRHDGGGAYAGYPGQARPGYSVDLGMEPRSCCLSRGSLFSFSRFITDFASSHI